MWRWGVVLLWCGSVWGVVVGVEGMADVAVDRKLEGTIAFATVGRAKYAFDVYALSLPENFTGRARDRVPVEELEETRLTDGVSVNYNGQLVQGKEKAALLQWVTSRADSPAADLRLLQDAFAANTGELMLFVSERDGRARVVIDLFLNGANPQEGFISDFESRGTSGGDNGLLTKVKRMFSDTTKSSQRKGWRILRETKKGRNVLQMELSLGSTGPYLHDRPQMGGSRIVYVSTEQPRKELRESWTAIYSTGVDSRADVRLTPAGVSDFSPSISPSGEWVLAASLQEKGWQGEIQELNTDLYVFSAKDGLQRRLVTRNAGWPSWADDTTAYFHRRADDGWWSIFKVALPEDFDANGFEEGDIHVERVTPPGIHAFTPSASQTGEWIAVATRRPESNFRHVELFDLRAKAFIKLTEKISPNAHHYNPDVSSGSSKIVYHRCRGSFGDSASVSRIPRLEPLQSPVPRLALLRVDGTFPSFSADGSLIAYVSDQSGENAGVVVTNLDGKGKWRIFNGPAFGTAWDHKRKAVVYTAHGRAFQSEDSEVHIISIFNADGERESYHRQLTKNGTSNNAFPWPSPDGKHLVFRSSRSGHKNLYIMDAVDGEREGLVRLTNGRWTDTMACWSPTGEWIAFASDRENPGAGHFSIFLVHPNGTGLHKVLGGEGRVNHPQFSPDGKSLVFASDFAAVSADPIGVPNQFQPYGEIYISSLDGSDPVRLTHNGYEDGTPAWGPTYIDASDLAQEGEDGVKCDFDDVMWLRTNSSKLKLPRRCATRSSANSGDQE